MATGGQGRGVAGGGGPQSAHGGVELLEVAGEHDGERQQQAHGDGAEVAVNQRVVDARRGRAARRLHHGSRGGGARRQVQPRAHAVRRLPAADCGCHRAAGSAAQSPSVDQQIARDGRMSRLLDTPSLTAVAESQRKRSWWLAALKPHMLLTDYMKNQQGRRVVRVRRFTGCTGCGMKLPLESRLPWE